MPATAISSNWKKLSKTLNKAKPIALPAAKKAKIEPLIKEEIDAVQLQELEKLSSTEITQRDLMIAEKILAGNADYNGESSGEDEQSAVPAVKKRAATMISIPNEKIGKYVGVDCEMVGVGEGGEQSVLARVSIVNFHGHIILDQYVLPRERVTDYRTHVSGITPKLLKEHGKEFTVVQRQVADILKNRIIVGHALKNDLNALLLTHPPHLIRDTATYKPLKNATTNKPIKLKTLVMTHLSLEIQEGEHSSVDDARAVMELFKKYKSAWEQTLVKFEFRKVKETSQDQ